MGHEYFSFQKKHSDQCAIPPADKTVSTSVGEGMFQKIGDTGIGLQTTVLLNFLGGTGNIANEENYIDEIDECRSVDAGCLEIQHRKK